MSSRGEYQPIEFYAQQQSDLKFLTWLIDQVGVLRSIFTLHQFNDRSGEEKMRIGKDWVLKIDWERDRLKAKCEDSFLSLARRRACPASRS